MPDIERAKLRKLAVIFFLAAMVPFLLSGLSDSGSFFRLDREVWLVLTFPAIVFLAWAYKDK